jgi:SAM-dependent methyltransferase
MLKRLRTVSRRAEHAGRGTGWEASAAVDRASRADLSLRTGPPVHASSRAGPVGRLARRVALRLMRPHIAHQQHIDRDVLDALLALGRDVSELGERGVAVEALSLSGLRDVEHRIRTLVEPELADASARTDDLARQVNELHAVLQGQSMLLSQPGLPTETDVDAYPEAPEEPWSEAYNAAHAAFVGHALDDAALIDAVRDGGALPDGYGRGFDERVVEFPWLAGRRLSGTVLDAGSTLNHLHVLRRLRPRMEELHIVTLAPEDRAFPALKVSYLFADLRRLPMGDGVYDRVLSLSTLEHVGLDLEHFGANGGQAEDPQEASLAAAAELRRVARAGGEVLITVPIGVPERFGWVRTFSSEELDALIARFDPVEVDIAYFRHDGGWQRADRASVADARYRDHLGGEAPRNGIVAAEAVACIALTLA